MARCGSCSRKPHGAQAPKEPRQPSRPGTDGRPTEAKISPAAHTTGRTQSFALQTRDGRTLVFGSRLERDAAKVRHGGRIVP